MQFGTEVEVSTVPDIDYALWYGTTAANFGRRCNHCAKALLGSHDYLGTGTSTTISIVLPGYYGNRPLQLRTQLFSYSEI